MPSRPSPLSLALATAFGTFAAVPAQALTTSTITGFTGSASVTATCTATSTKCTGVDNDVSPATLATPLLAQFDASLGVLTATTLYLDSTRTQTLDGSFTSSKPPAGATTSGTGSSAAQLTAPGVNQSFPPIGFNKTTGTVGPGNLNGSYSAVPESKTTPNDPTTGFVASTLDPYVGTGTVAVTLAADTKFTAATQWESGGGKTPPVITATSSATYGLTWTGKITATYDYLEHARASFASPTPDLSLDLDFGTLFLNEAATAIPFSIFNLAGDRVGLDLDSILGVGDVSRLTTNLSLFTNLAVVEDPPGPGQLDYLASFDTSTLGLFAASYTLCFSDEDVGASASRYDCSIDPDHFQLTLNLLGRVVEREPIPEPATLGLLGIGLAGLAWRRRRR